MRRAETARPRFGIPPREPTWQALWATHKRTLTQPDQPPDLRTVACSVAHTRYPLPAGPCILYYVFVEIDGLRVYVERAGDGPPVLLLHGWQNSARTLAPVRQALAPAYTVWALDLPGFGLSMQPPTPWGIEDYADFVRHAMLRLALVRPDVLGHSRGGAIGIVLAARSPELLNRLILVDSAGIRAPRTWKLRLRGATARSGRRLLDHPWTGRTGKGAITWLYGRLGMQDYRDAGPMRATFVKLVNQDLSPLLPLVRAPTLILWGARDRETPLWMGQKLAAAIPNARLSVFEQAGHHPFLEQPAAFNRAVLDFLNHDVLDHKALRQS